MTDHSSLSDLLHSSVKNNPEIWNPIILNPKIDSDYRLIRELLQKSNPIVTDEIRDQLKELVKLRNPSERIMEDHADHAITEILDGCPIDYYGLWVYYPWSNRMVHLLPEDEFIEVRTNRNHYKISPKEESILAGKRIGLIGLSVGQSVAVTMAMERGFGELRIADFDRLELTNLNRIRTGVHNLGVPKVISVAREIMEIDPFLKVKCFMEGLTEDNMDDFFEENGKLDLLIDECDGLDIKVLARWKAKSLGIPVVMEASDRGMVDVERFDLDPERPILHGLIEDLRPEKLKELKTNEDKIPYMLDIVGPETISTRAKASMLEIGETISTWPQLASAVTLGGGITADVVRRILLDQFHGSGRYYMDVEEIIGDPLPDASEKSLIHPVPDSDFGKEMPSSRDEEVVDENEIESIIRAACHAPSGGNLQPWKWTSKKNLLQLKFDRNLVSSFLDHGDIASMIALGASLENARLMAANKDIGSEIEFFPEPDDPEIIARLRLTKKMEPEPSDKYLGGFVLDRETNRNIEPGPPLTDHMKVSLMDAARRNGSALLLIEHGNNFDKLAKWIAFTERFRIMHPKGHRNFVEEMRWTKEEAEATRDGIDIRTVDLTIGELTGFKLARDADVVNKLKEWEGGSAFENLSKKATGAAAALGIITRKGTQREDYLKAGMDMERVWIDANSMGLGFQPQSPLSLLLPRLAEQKDLTGEEVNQLSQAEKALKEVVLELSGGEPIFIFRLFRANRPVVKSLRRDLHRHYRRIE